MKKSKIPKLCQNIGLGKLFLELGYLKDSNAAAHSVDTGIS